MEITNKIKSSLPVFLSEIKCGQPFLLDSNCHTKVGENGDGFILYNFRTEEVQGGFTDREVFPVKCQLVIEVYHAGAI